MLEAFVRTKDSRSVASRYRLVLRVLNKFGWTILVDRVLLLAEGQRRRLLSELETWL